LLTDFEGDLNDPKGSTRRKDIAKRGIEKLGKC
jgi:rhs family protein